MSKLNLVLDWDHTLAFSIPASQASSYKDGLLRAKQPDAVIDVDRNGTPVKTLIFYRPGLEQLLEVMSQQYNLGLWSYGVEAYIHSCLKAGDLDRYFSHIRARPAHPSDFLIKDLAQLGYPLNEVVIVDDHNALFGVLNPLNCVAIRPWDGIDDFDRQLEVLPELVARKFAFLREKDPRELERLRQEILQQTRR